VKRTAFASVSLFTCFSLYLSVCACVHVCIHFYLCGFICLWVSETSSCLCESPAVVQPGFAIWSMSPSSTCMFLLYDCVGMPVVYACTHIYKSILTSWCVCIHVHFLQSLRVAHQLVTSTDNVKLSSGPEWQMRKAPTVSS
jgi:hypothetical protein